ncbi:MAG: gliding motility-associated C-terminal domain-containing protein [Flavobacteriales bacterium]|nr:gliding motility-associated C-terminal domain-containing protein [Flavobacteriales bacterium]
MRKLLRLFLVLGLQLVVQGANATHNQAGEILVCYVGGYGYEVTIVTHTNPDSPADRPFFILQWGDGFTDTIPRLSDDVITVAGIEVQKNIYVSGHTYPGPGTYILQYEDPNRVANVINVDNGNSVDVPMCVQSMITVLPQLDWRDCLPEFTNPPIQNACLGECWEHNPGAFDLDGDSLSFEPRVCLGMNCDPVPNYEFPDQVGPGADNQYDIDPVTGTITWCAPQEAGIYNIAFAVVEYRKIAGTWFEIGWVMRDMQVIVGACDNRPPVIANLLDTCVEAGTTLNFTVFATDVDPGQVITLSAIGGPFEVPDSPALFPTNAIGPSPVSGTFTWNTNCSHVQQQPYQAIFKAQDNWQPVQLVDYETMFITVVAPAPQDPTATPNGSIMQLAWDASVCTNAKGYRLYRRQGLFGFDPDNCETGVPGYTGYQFIGSTSGVNSTTYNDQSLSFGITYCYMVVAVFDDGAQSYASEEFCNLLERDVPIMTNVTVVSTDNSTGSDTIIWSNAYDLDIVQYPGPYYFKLYEGASLNTANTLIHTTASSPLLQHPDTVFWHQTINTSNTPHAYRVELFGINDTFIGTGNTASSVFLVLEPNDEQITIQMNHNTPWINTLFEVYRETSPDLFTLIGTSTTETYVDTGLVNGQPYCYKARTVGAYNDPDIASPLINWSQEACAAPVDLTPPCVPTLALDNDCEQPLNTLTWNNPNETCGNDDTDRYNIWFTDSLGGTLQLIATITGAEITEYLHTDGQSVAGCYAVSAIDLVGNESALSDTVCGDNCPVYTLPNVFTPNNDNTNDFFVPFPYRGVKEIDLKIFNRWGLLVFSSKDPAIQWPGTLKQTSEPVSDGVYFYTCGVSLKRLAGDEFVQLKGYVHILRGNNVQQN